MIKKQEIGVTGGNKRITLQSLSECGNFRDTIINFYIFADGSVQICQEVWDNKRSGFKAYESRIR